MSVRAASVWPGDGPEKCQAPGCDMPIRSVFVYGPIEGNTGDFVLCPGCSRTRGVGTKANTSATYERRASDRRFVKIL